MNIDSCTPIKPPPPSWNQQMLAREERPWYTWTGDVNVFGGHTFPDSFTSLDAAVHHAQDISHTLGAVAVLQHAKRFYLTRAFNAEEQPLHGLVVGHTQINGGRDFTHLNPALRALVANGAVAVSQPA